MKTLFYIIRTLARLLVYPFELPRKPNSDFITGSQFMLRLNEFSEKNLLHTTWRDTRLTRGVRVWWRTQCHLNQDFVFVLWTDDCVSGFMSSNSAGGGFSQANFDRLSNNQMKADVFRYRVVYRYGGVWIDINKGITAPLSQIFELPLTSLHVSYESNTNIILPSREVMLMMMQPFNVVANWCFAAGKNNEILRKVIAHVDEALELLSASGTPINSRHVVGTSGPGVFHQAVVAGLERGESVRQHGIDFNGLGLSRIPRSWALGFQVRTYDERRSLGRILKN